MEVQLHPKPFQLDSAGADWGCSVDVLGVLHGKFYCRGFVQQIVELCIDEQ